MALWPLLPLPPPPRVNPSPAWPGTQSQSLHRPGLSSITLPPAPLPPTGPVHPPCNKMICSFSLLPLLCGPGEGQSCCGAGVGGRNGTALSNRFLLWSPCSAGFPTLPETVLAPAPEGREKHQV